MNKQEERIVCIDRVRGFIVFCMVFFQCAERFESLGILGRIADHSPTHGIMLMPGLALADLAAPLFFMLISLNYIPSLKRRIERDGRGKAYFHFTVRYLSILGFGSCIKVIEEVFIGNAVTITYILVGMTAIALLCGIAVLLFGLLKKAKAKSAAKNIMIAVLTVIGVISLAENIYATYPLLVTKGDVYEFWGVLQSIGGAGLLMLLFAESSTAVRGIAAVLFWAIFALIHQIPGNMELIDIPVQGGAAAILSWGSMLLAFSVMSDLFYRDRAAKAAGCRGIRANSYLIGLAVLIIPAIIAGTSMVINKGSVSPGYVLINLPISAGAFWLISLTDKWRPKFSLLLWWGASPILMYLMQYITQDIILSLVPAITEWSLIPALCYVLIINGLITLLAYWLYKNKKTVKV